MKTVRDFNFNNKRVLVRCDFNVPLSLAGDILDDFKIKQSLPTIEYLMSKKAGVILMSHLGDPKGEAVERLSLNKVTKHLTDLLRGKVVLVRDYKEKEVAVRAGEIVLLENLRFYPEEEKGDVEFVKKLAGLADIYLNDAFAVSHRPHASLIVPKFLPSGAGLLLEKEIKVMSGIRDNPKKPLVVVIAGNTKGIETKAKFIEKMTEKPQTIVLLGNLVADELNRQRSYLCHFGKWRRAGLRRNLILPVDSLEGLDIGPNTVKLFEEEIGRAKTVFWSGPLGKIEEQKFTTGSLKIAKAVIKSKAFAVAGGGETGWFLRQHRLANKFNYISTGGDAMLMFLSGESLPGIEVLKT